MINGADRACGALQCLICMRPYVNRYTIQKAVEKSIGYMLSKNIPNSKPVWFIFGYSRILCIYNSVKYKPYVIICPYLYFPDINI